MQKDTTAANKTLHRLSRNITAGFHATFQRADTQNLADAQLTQFGHPGVKVAQLGLIRRDYLATHDRLFGGAEPCIVQAADGGFACNNMDGITDQQIDTVFMAWQAAAGSNHQVTARFLDATLPYVQSTRVRHKLMDALLVLLDRPHDAPNLTQCPNLIVEIHDLERAHDFTREQLRQATVKRLVAGDPDILVSSRLRQLEQRAAQLAQQAPNADGKTQLIRELSRLATTMVKTSAFRSAPGVIALAQQLTAATEEAPTTPAEKELLIAISHLPEPVQLGQQVSQQLADLRNCVSMPEPERHGFLSKAIDQLPRPPQGPDDIALHEACLLAMESLQDAQLHGHSLFGLLWGSYLHQHVRDTGHPLQPLFDIVDFSDGLNRPRHRDNHHLRTTLERMQPPQDAQWWPIGRFLCRRLVRLMAHALSDPVQRLDPIVPRLVSLFSLPSVGTADEVRERQQALVADLVAIITPKEQEAGKAPGPGFLTRLRKACERESHLAKPAAHNGDPTAQRQIAELRQLIQSIDAQLAPSRHRH